MDKFLSVIEKGLISNESITEINKCNEYTKEYGLRLSIDDIKNIITTRGEALKSSGRIEFSTGIINKIILAFADSPYISQYNYVDTINDLLDTFYYYKNETLEQISDDELIEMMKEFFDGSCQGSIEILKNRELCKIEYNIKYGIKDYRKIGDDKDLEGSSYYENDDN